jgi:hypothetical protein
MEWKKEDLACTLIFARIGRENSFRIISILGHVTRDKTDRKYRYYNIITFIIYMLFTASKILDIGHNNRVYRSKDRHEGLIYKSASVPWDTAASCISTCLTSFHYKLTLYAFSAITINPRSQKTDSRK